MKRMEVRCCCKPQKLLGWLPVPSSVAEGETLHFVAPARVFRVGQPDDWIEQYRTQPRDVIALRVAMFAGAIRPGVFSEHLALKSEETPIEILRRIPSFIEKEQDL